MGENLIDGGMRMGFDRLELWWNCGMVGWWDGGMVGWWDGGMVGWWNGEKVGWWDGGMVDKNDEKLKG